MGVRPAAAVMSTATTRVVGTLDGLIGDGDGDATKSPSSRLHGGLAMQAARVFCVRLIQKSSGGEGRFGHRTAVHENLHETGSEGM